MLGQNLNVFLMIDLTNNMELGIINTAKEKSSPFMQICLQILSTYQRAPLSSLERLSLTMEMDITLPPVNSLQNWREEISSGSKHTIIVLPLYMKIIHTCLDTKLMDVKVWIATLLFIIEIKWLFQLLHYFLLYKDNLRLFYNYKY